MTRPMSLRSLARESAPAAIASAAAALVMAFGGAPHASAAPAPELEYLYNVMVRRHYNFPNSTEALNYGYGICDKVSRGESYGHLMGDLRSDLATSDEGEASYLMSYSVNLLCPQSIWQLRNSAAQYRPPAP